MSNTDTTNHEGASRYNIRVLDRAIRILKVLSDGKPRTLNELSGEITLNHSTTFRLLSTLTSYGYLRRNGNSGKYQLGLACLELTKGFLEGNDLHENATHELEALRDDVRETVHLAILDRMEVVYLEKLSGLHAIGMMGSRVGGRSPAHCTGLGKVLLAHLDPQVVRKFYEENPLTRYTETTLAEIGELMDHLESIRQQGYAIDRGEHESEVFCIAAPIYDRTNKVIAALSLSGPSARLDPIEKNTVLIERTKAAAEAISLKLGYRLNRSQLPVNEEKQNAENH